MPSPCLKNSFTYHLLKYATRGEGLAKTVLQKTVRKTKDVDRWTREKKRTCQDSPPENSKRKTKEEMGGQRHRMDRVKVSRGGGKQRHGQIWFTARDGQYIEILVSAILLLRFCVLPQYRYRLNVCLRTHRAILLHRCSVLPHYRY